MPNPKNSTNQKFSDAVRDAAMQEISTVLQQLNTSPSGLSETEAAARLEQYGFNEVAQEKQHGWLFRLWGAVRNPLVILLAVLVVITFATAGAPCLCCASSWNICHRGIGRQKASGR